MAKAVGIAIEHDVVRAVWRAGSRLESVEVPWSISEPERMVSALRERVGTASSLSVAVGLAFLEVARPELPPMPATDARRLLLRDTDRYFPLDTPAAISYPEPKSIAFATDSAQLRRMLRALEQWAPVHAVVAAPDAIAHAMRNLPSAETVHVDAAPTELGVLLVRGGKLLEARRVPSAVAESARHDVGRFSKNVHELPINFAAAIGALELTNADVGVMLADVTVERGLRGIRQRRRLFSHALLAASVVLLAMAVDSSRARTLRVTNAAVDSLTALSAPGMASRARAALNERELAVLRDHGLKGDSPLAVLSQVSAALPADAFVQRIDWDGKEWRLEGSASQTAAIVPHLDALPGFTAVHVLNASTRFRDGNRTRESFSVAFRIKETDVVSR